MTDLILLAMLAGGPKHGYRLKREAAAVFGQGELHNNLVYPLLRRFTAEGWVTKKTMPGSRGQTRQQYAITPLGRRTLLERLREFSEQDARSEDAFRTRVGLFEMLPPEDVARILSVREDFLRSRNERLTVLQKAMDLGVYGAEVVVFQRRQIETELAWIRRLHQLNSKQNSRSRDHDRS